MNWYEADMNVGDHIRVERDEKKYPSRGTWRRYSGKTGYICIVDESSYGVVLTVTRPPWRKDSGREHELSYDSDAILWFRPHELVVLK